MIIIRNSYDKDENNIEKVVETDTSDIINYVYENDLTYLKGFRNVKDAKWLLEVDGPGAGAFISGTKEEPKWFKELLKELKADENGYLYNE